MHPGTGAQRGFMSLSIDMNSFTAKIQTTWIHQSVSICSIHMYIYLAY